MWLKKTSTSSWQRERFLESDRIEYVPLGSSTQLAPGISLSTWETFAHDGQQTELAITRSWRNFILAERKRGKIKTNALDVKVR